MKAIMLSIRPEWCEKIISGKKTIEVRKTRPKTNLPFKCYIYCTYGRRLIERFDSGYPNMLLEQKATAKEIWSNCCNGKVIGEFVCDEITEYTNYSLDEQSGHIKRRENLLRSACMTLKDWRDYIGSYASDFGYAWHISNLVMYDEPKPLAYFYNECPGLDNTGMCYECENAVGDECDCALNGRRHLSRPPQSWCYVEGYR